jgi:type 1 fimbria pilin
MRKHRRLSAVILAATLSFQAGATQTGDQVDVTFHGVLKRRPCHINNDRPIEVHFGNVGVDKVDGVRYKQALSYSVVCDAPDPNAVMTLMVKGTPTGFDPAAVSTSANGLGIQILQNSQPFVLNQQIRGINHPPLPTLEVVPVKDPAVALAESRFTATATLLAEYY